MGQLGLHAEVELIYRRNEAILAKGVKTRRRQQRGLNVSDGCDVLQASIAHGWGKDSRRVAEHVECLITLKTIVENACSSAQYIIPFAGEIISNTKTRGEEYPRVVLEVLIYFFSCLSDSI